MTEGSSEYRHILEDPVLLPATVKLAFVVLSIPNPLLRYVKSLFLGHSSEWRTFAESCLADKITGLEAKCKSLSFTKPGHHSRDYARSAEGIFVSSSIVCVSFSLPDQSHGGGYDPGHK